MTGQASSRTFRALSVLLTYPTAELAAAVPEIDAAIKHEGLLSPEAAQRLQPLLAELRAMDLYDLQERYVALFDKTRRHALHLFEHIHGESRDRGQAMVDLAAHYERGGLLIAANELPDFIPLFLEFLSARPLDEARSLLKETAHILSLLEERLAQRNADYAAVFTAILSIAGDVSAIADGMQASDEPDDLSALDAAWEETAVTFGPENAIDGCSADRLRIQMRAANRDARRGAA
ncbi:MAG: nitrate reductase molybdenum cofactor assembly chaperone [Rhizobiales bacterium 65-9]|nr:nitrate reductase molybdenum cofactor assembly chaperone [Hyphomicrobiales bacterium]OJY36897.1 MAG: nitrate reductase molybdenum cofactor assembly chaperone [Rhizobiales bacterium 65-9]